MRTDASSAGISLFTPYLHLSNFDQTTVRIIAIWTIVDIPWQEEVSPRGFKILPLFIEGGDYLDGDFTSISMSSFKLAARCVS